MQDILETRDRLRADIEALDGGYTTIGRLLKQSDVSVLKALKPDNKPRLSTLEKIAAALEEARIRQKTRLQRINA